MKTSLWNFLRGILAELFGKPLEHKWLNITRSADGADHQVDYSWILSSCMLLRINVLSPDGDS